MGQHGVDYLSVLCGALALHQSVQSGQVRDRGDNGLQGTLALDLEVLAARKVGLQLHKAWEGIIVRKCLGVLRSVAAQLA